MSGSQFRQQKLERDKQKKKQAGSLKNFLKISQSQESPSEDSVTLAPPSTEPMEVQDDSSTTSEDNITKPVTSTSTSVFSDILNYGDDPGMWPANISNEVVNILIKRGPIQVLNFNYPINKDGRKFSNSYFTRNLPNGEKIQREWLVYSTSKDSVFCFACKIFGKSKSIFSGLDGFSDWQHLSHTINRHERSVSHNENIKTWVQLNNMVKNKTTVNAIQLRMLESEKKHWRDVLERIIAVIKYLSRQCLALRGSSKTLYENNNGNFLKGIEMIACFDTVMREHVARIQSVNSDSHRVTHYLGDQIQNEIIDLLGNSIKNNIIKTIRESKYFSIILDCTPDVSHTEQISIVLRHVVLDNESKDVLIHENFIGFCPITNSTGEGLSNFVVNLFSQLNLDIQNLRGQGYDNGANMRGKHNGLQKKILEINNRAFYVPCSAHSLNLVVNDAASITHETVNFFNIIQDIYIFFSSSTKRWSVICKHVTDLKLKPLSGTRWSSRIDAVKPLRYHLAKIFDALIDISENLSEWDCMTTHKAQSLALQIQNYKFICSIVIWFNFLNEINVLSKMMQNPKINTNLCINLVNKLIENFTNCRTDEYFESVLEEAKTVAIELNAEIDFPLANTVRPRRKPTQFAYENRDEVLIDPKNKYKIEFFFRIIDQIIMSLKYRFEELQTYTDIFGFFGNNLFKIPKDELRKHCNDLQLKLMDEKTKNSDIDGIDLFNEINSLQLHLEIDDDYDPEYYLKYLYSNDLISTFPNTTIALRILLSLPVSVASGERSFSKLKIIKNYLRSTMVEERLCNLAIISIEHENLDKLKLDKIIEDFASAKARRVQF